MTVLAKFRGMEAMEIFDSKRLSRRALLRSATVLAGGAALGMRPAHASAGKPKLNPGMGRGRSVAVLGGGMAGLTAGWMLANAGYKVTVFEADSRYGGRSLTVRPSDPGYKRWWLTKYPEGNLFPGMYVSSYKEARGPNANVPQICNFVPTPWYKDGPQVELFLNAGPGRIPSDHKCLLDLCGEIGVALEPYTFQSNYNLLRSEKFNKGEPIAYNQVNYSLRGAIAAKLAEYENITNCDPNTPETSAMAHMLREFGDLSKKCEYDVSARRGFGKLPGGWNDGPPVVKEKIPLDDILKSGFVGGGNPELSPGSFLFNADNILWQNSLMQPIGGMDRIWQRLLVQKVPAASFERFANDIRKQPVPDRDGKIHLGDLVALNFAATGVTMNRDKVQITLNGGRAAYQADFCISTMAPQLLARVLSDQFSKDYKSALNEVRGQDEGEKKKDWVPAIKVGWQAKSRFWEQRNHIYGGISWTDDDIGQIWYPCEDFNAATGVLTGAYNRGPVAEAFGNMPQADRITHALKGGNNLHPPKDTFSGFEKNVYADRGVTIAWQHMPNQQGGWTPVLGNSKPAVYKKIVEPQSSPADPSKARFFVAGDTYSWLPGWIEGSVTSAYEAVGVLVMM